MLSHLRFHRRAPSNPTSPLPDQLGSWEATAIHDHPQTAQDVSPRPEVRPRSSNSAQLPPVLPPIARVTSADSEFSFPVLRENARPVSQGQDSHLQSLTRPGYDAGNSSFIGGIALQNRMAAQTSGTPQQSPEPTPAPAAQENLISRSKPPPPPINTGFTSRLTPTPVNTKPSSFVTPTDLAQNSGIPGKRPTGARMASEPTTSTTAPETHKGKRGLPFLKNPMSSLLMRRKTAQPTAELQPLPNIMEPTYDPRIKGTKVHDFSAPRPKRVVPSRDAANTTSPPVMHPNSDPDRPQFVGEQNGEPLYRVQQPVGPPDPRIIADLENQITKPSELDMISPEAEQFSVRKPDRPPPPVPEKDASSVHTSSSTTSRTYSVETSVMPRTTSSRRTVQSNHPSISRASTRASVMSSIPKHMKSTSSRFSFDMIGSASQEKILEERHRQREQEKKTTDEAIGPRDSRYDEFDEDFDYDAMMDDDGLEERIPGVNADLEDEYDDYGVGEDDPDNDQENFAGFVFQRSNPTSSLASPNTPGMLATPRDANGRVIGFAMTKDTTPDLPPTASPMYLHEMSFPTQEDDTTGLGIGQLTINSNEKMMDTQAQVQTNNGTPALATAQPRATEADELYFDDGLADELDFEHNDPPFDESIFDNLDTDQYGRPIPGAFALAHEAMRAAQQQQASKRVSDEVTTSQFSGPSGASQSTAHTSLSAGLQPLPQVEDKEAELQQPQAQQPITSVPGQDLLYQAALAAAAQKAAASGKFNRSESPPLPTELTVTSPTDSSDSFQQTGIDGALNDYDTNEYNPNDYEAEDDYNPDDYESAGQYATYIDDDDFDDDVIAEANASALANDSDGFYGQEFGFYSAPLPQPHHGHSHQNSTSSTLSANNVPLSAENLFQYANGGYFGPAGGGIYRSQSGRVVSREPNLTPITERSEYSNRNSVMSLALPPVIGSEGAGGRSSSAGIPSSPGLAQLALLSSDDDTMSMSALMRLRSKAWGGSQASGLSSREGSPRSERAAIPPPNGLDSGGGGSPFGGGSFGSGLPQYQHARKNSNFSIWSANSDAGGAAAGAGAGAGESGPGSPTITMMMPQPQSYPQAQFGTATGGGFTSPLASSPFPPPDATSPLQQQLYIHSNISIPIPSAPSPGHVAGVSNNPCSPVLESESEEAGFEDDQDRTLTVNGLQPSPCPPIHLPPPNPLYPSWTNTPVQAQAAARLAMMGVGNAGASTNGMNGTNRANGPLATPTFGVQTTMNVNGGGSGSSGPPSPQMLMRRPASASGSVSATGFGQGRPGSGMGHRHKGSADSISYVREDVVGGVDGADGESGAYGGAGEDDYVGGSGGVGGGGVTKTRWVMERRRTDESTGEVEILGREVVEAGRI